MSESATLKNLVEALTDSLDENFPKNNFRKRVVLAYPMIDEIPFPLFLKYLINLSEPMREYIQSLSKGALTKLRTTLQGEHESRDLRAETTEMVFWALVNSFARPTNAVKASHNGEQHWLPHCYLKNFTQVKSYQRKASGRQLRFTEVSLKKIDTTTLIATRPVGESTFIGEKKNTKPTIEDVYLELFYSKLETGYSIVMMRLREDQNLVLTNWDRISMHAFVAGHFIRVSPEDTLTEIPRKQWHFYRGTIGKKNHLSKFFESIDRLTEYEHVEVKKASRLLPLAPTHLPVLTRWQESEAFYFPVSNAHAVVFSSNRLTSSEHKKVEELYVRGVLSKSKRYGLPFFMHHEASPNDLIRFVS